MHDDYRLVWVRFVGPAAGRETGDDGRAPAKREVVTKQIIRMNGGMLFYHIQQSHH